MIFYYLDASAWIKRYYQESGTTWVQGLFAQNQAIACASLGLIEVTATLARKRKSGEVHPSLLEQKLQELEEDWEGFIQVQLTAETMDVAKRVARDLALRGSDAMHLAAAMVLKRRLSEEDDQLILVTSDRELKESAQASDLATIDPDEAEKEAAHQAR